MSLTEKAQRRAIANLSLMKFFPGDTDTRAAICKFLQNTCPTDEHVDRLIRKYTACYPEWDGVYELRACACSIFKPVDGMEVPSNRYPEGVPAFAELDNPALAAIPAAARRLDLPPAKQIEAAKSLHSAEFTADPELEELVRSTAAACRAPEVPKPRTVQEIEQILYSRKQA